MDHQTANLRNFDGQIITSNIGSDYAEQMRHRPLPGTALVGKSETLTFNGDGTATLSRAASGASATVKMAHCI